MGNQFLEYSVKALLSQIHPALQKVQSLMPTDKEDRDRLKASIEKNGIRDPLKVIYSEDDGEPYLISGWTRLKIASELGLQTVPILPVNPQEDPEDYAISENLDRRQLTLEQKRILAGYLLKKNPEKSDRQIAKESGISHPTVTKIREESRGKIYHVSQTQGGKPSNKKDSLGRKVGEKPIPKPTVKKLRDEIAGLKKQRAQIDAQIKKLEDQLQRATK